MHGARLVFSLVDRARLALRRPLDLVYDKPELASITTANLGYLRLRQMKRADHLRVNELRYGEREWLGPWEASAPVGYPVDPPTFEQYVASCNRQILDGRMMPLVIEGDGQAIGQLTISDISRAATQSCAIGYWISQTWANMGLMTLAVAMALDACFTDLNLHRAEINIRPENARSLAIPRKLGLRKEGVRRKYICIDGSWADHVSFAATVEDAHGGFVARLEAHKQNNSCY